MRRWIPASPPEEDPESCDFRLWLEGLKEGRRWAPLDAPSPPEIRDEGKSVGVCFAADSGPQVCRPRRVREARVPAGPIPCAPLEGPEEVGERRRERGGLEGSGEGGGQEKKRKKKRK